MKLLWIFKFKTFLYSKLFEFLNILNYYVNSNFKQTFTDDINTHKITKMKITVYKLQCKHFKYKQLKIRLHLRVRLPLHLLLRLRLRLRLRHQLRLLLLLRFRLRLRLHLRLHVPLSLRLQKYSKLLIYETITYIQISNKLLLMTLILIRLLKWK